MMGRNVVKCITTCVFALLLACPFDAAAQQAVDADGWVAPENIFRPEELDQMLAPIALYPDALLAQVLAAATYPKSIAAADQFVKSNPGASAQSLVDAARNTDWSPSVKAMLQFSNVLAMMNQHLDWTTNLGIAFLAQQRDVMDSVQRLRQRAYQQGALVTTNQLFVRYDPQTYSIAIDPANPQMVYVPVYDPNVVYGTWWYPDYPPYRYYYPGYSGYSDSLLISFLAGIILGDEDGWGGWGFDWHNHQSNIYVDRYNSFVGRSYANPHFHQIGGARGRAVAYNTQFHRNSGYRNNATTQPLGAQRVSGIAAKGPGASGQRGANQVQAKPSASTVSAPAVSTGKQPVSKTKVKGKAQNRPAISSPVSAPAVSTAKQPVSRTTVKEVAQNQPAASSPVPIASRSSEGVTAFSGIGSGGNVRAASFRGQSSLKSSPNVGVSRAAVVSQTPSAVSKGGARSGGKKR